MVKFKFKTNGQRSFPTNMLIYENYLQKWNQLSISLKLLVWIWWIWNLCVSMHNLPAYQFESSKLRLC